MVQLGIDSHSASWTVSHSADSSTQPAHSAVHWPVGALAWEWVMYIRAPAYGVGCLHTPSPRAGPLAASTLPGVAILLCLSAFVFICLHFLHFCIVACSALLHCAFLHLSAFALRMH